MVGEQTLPTSFRLHGSLQPEERRGAQEHNGPPPQTCWFNLLLKFASGKVEEADPLNIFQELFPCGLTSLSHSFSSLAVFETVFKNGNHFQSPLAKKSALEILSKHYCLLLDLVPVW